MVDIPPASGVYRPAWETVRAQTIPYNVVGDPPQWGDNSDASYADCAAEIITEGTSSTGEKTLPTSDFAAHPDVDQVAAIKIRMVQAVLGSPEPFGQITWRLLNKVTGADIATPGAIGEEHRAPATPATRIYPLTLSGTGLALLHSGDLAVEVSIHAGEFGSRIRIYETWLMTALPLPTRRRIAHNRGVQRGSDGQGVTGGKRGLQRTSRQSSLRGGSFL